MPLSSGRQGDFDTVYSKRFLSQKLVPSQQYDQECEYAAGQKEKVGVEESEILVIKI